MKTVILAGGFGTRISEESHLKPKPMIEIGEKPILWHIMNDHLEHPGIKGTGQQMTQFRSKAAAGDCVIPRCLNITHGALVIQLHDPVEELLVCTILSTGQK